MLRIQPHTFSYGIMLLFVVGFICSTTAVLADLPVTADGESPFAVVYEKVAPTIVWIDVTSEAQTRRIGGTPWQQFFNAPDQEPRQIEGMGSGVIIDADGYIITNNHVIENYINITVKIDEDHVYDAKLVGSDPQTDLAVIKIELDGEQLPPERVAVFGDSDLLKPGDYAIAIGNPLALEKTITVGIISGLGRHGLEVRGDTETIYQDYIQTDAQINPGNSGGALVNIRGEVVGINNMYAARTAGIGFAIPINMAREVAAQLMATGTVKRGIVGIKGKDITRETQEAMNLPSTHGFMVYEIAPGYPAEAAGIEQDDVIVSINGKQLNNYNDFLLEIGRCAPGETVSFGVIRDGIEKIMTITLADRADYEVELVADDTSNRSWRGLSVVSLDSQLARRFRLGDETSGVIIVQVDEGSPADDANITAGEIITEIEGTSIRTLNDYERIRDQLEHSNKNVLIYLKRNQGNGNFVNRIVAVKSE